MTISTQTPSDLFATKGRAMPACSKPMAARPAAGASPSPEPERKAAQDDGPASVLTIDLRQALVPARDEPPKSEPAKSEPQRSQASTGVAPQPQDRSVAGPFIGALIAVGIAAGLFYIFEQDRFTAATDAETAQPEAAAPAETDGPAQDAEANAGDTEPAGDTALPSFDLVRVEPDGSAVIAGRAAPNADLILLHNGEPIGKAKADWAGEWAFVTDKPLTAERHQITILVNDPDAEITLPEDAQPENAEPPSQVSGAGDTQTR